MSSEPCNDPVDALLPMGGTVTYELPLKLILNLDDPRAGVAFRELCGEHRQVAVDQLVELMLAVWNAGGGGFGVFVRDVDIDEEMARITG